MIIYKITNLVNGKMYIGQTIRPLEKRWKAHYRERHSDRPISRALCKYGRENFKIEEITRASSRDELDELEKFWIIELDTMNPLNGYNARGGGNTGRGVCEETRTKMSLAKKGKPSNKKDFSCSPETAAKISAANKGKIPWNKGLPQSEEQKQAHSLKMVGRKAWNKGIKRNNKPIIAINLDTNEEIEFPSIHEVVSVLKIGRCAVQNVLSGRGKRTSNNFTYRYK